jgi:hypothetical protein
LHHQAGWTIGCFLTAAGLTAFACASTEDEIYSTPYRTTPPEPSKSDASVGVGTGGNTTGPPTMDASQPPITPPVVDECAAFCPQSFGQACCDPTGQCGFDIGFGCIVIPVDAGPGTGPGTGGAGPGGSPPPAVQVDCRSDGECEGGSQCCATRSGGGVTAVDCQETCGSEDTPVACNNGSACSDGEVCCGHTETAGTNLVYVAIACEASCDGQNDYTLCGSNDECSGQTQCLESTLLPPGFSVCR